MYSSPPTKQQLLILYTAGRSMWEISQTLNCSVHKVTYWMSKYQIARRTRSEATYLKLNPNGNPFKIIETFTLNDMLLLGLGLGIYWGEGEKVSRHAIRVGNTDPAILRTFIKFLLKICQLEKRKLGYSIICFNDSNPNSAKKYWAKELGINPEKFGKIVQIPPQGKGTYKRKSQFGVCYITVSNLRLKTWIMGEIEKIKDPDIV